MGFKKFFEEYLENDSSNEEIDVSDLDNNESNDDVNIENLEEKINHKESGMVFPNVKGWKLSLIGNTYSNDGEKNIQYTKRVGPRKNSKPVYVHFMDIDNKIKNKMYRFGSGESDASISGLWKNVKEIPKILADLEKNDADKI